MGSVVNSKISMTERRQQVAELLSKGVYSRRRIADATGVSVATAQHDVEAVYALWQAEAKDDAGVAIVRQLNEIAKLRAETWAEWERSKQQAVKTTTSIKKTPKVDVNGKPYSEEESTASRTAEEQCGDPRYLKILNDLADREAKLLGLYSPTRIEMSGIAQVVEVVVTSRSEIPTLQQMVADGRFHGLASDN